MRILGIDYGDARVGVAINDELNITAQGLETIYSKGSDKVVLKRLEEIINEFNIEKLIVGMPYNMNGSESFRAEATKKFIHKLKCRFNKVEVETIDERLTTVQSHQVMNDLNIKKSKKMSLVDTISAVYILEVYMERNK